MLHVSNNKHFARFSDRDLQDEPLQIRIMDYDTYSANDAIGKGKMVLLPDSYYPVRG